MEPILILCNTLEQAQRRLHEWSEFIKVQSNNNNRGVFKNGRSFVVIPAAHVAHTAERLRGTHIHEVWDWTTLEDPIHPEVWIIAQCLKW